MIIGDHIETSGNADCLRAAAKLFDWECGFLDDLGDSVDLRGLARSGVPILAIENSGGAEDLFKYRDYYEGTGRSEFTFATSVEEGIEMGGERPPVFDPAPLIAAFPFDLWDQPKA